MPVATSVAALIAVAEPRAARRAGGRLLRFRAELRRRSRVAILPVRVRLGRAAQRVLAHRVTDHEGADAGQPRLGRAQPDVRCVRWVQRGHADLPVIAERPAAAAKTESAGRCEHPGPGRGNDDGDRRGRRGDG